jgi:hypothetical protein
MVYFSSLKENQGLYPQIIKNLPRLFQQYGINALTVTKAAISKKLAKIDWRIFRDIYIDTLDKYSALIETDMGDTLNVFRDIHLIDSTSIRLTVLLEEAFKATNKGASALKLHTKFSLRRFVPIDIKIGPQKEHDINYDFVSNERDVLYVADLGYWCFDLFKKLCVRRAFFYLA